MTLLLALLLANLPQPQLPDAEVRPVSRGADPRSERPWVISGEVGWNGLAGIGAVVARRFDPHFTVEAGVGLSAEDAKVGLRARWNFLVSEWTPFLGAGFMYGAGFGGAGQVDDSNPSRIYTFTIGPSPYAQLVTGMEFQSRSGFNFMFALGYARLLRHNLTILAGSPTADDLAGVRIATGSGPVVSTSMGYAF